MFTVFHIDPEEGVVEGSLYGSLDDAVAEATETSKQNLCLAFVISENEMVFQAWNGYVDNIFE